MITLGLFLILISVTISNIIGSEIDNMSTRKIALHMAAVYIFCLTGIFIVGYVFNDKGINYYVNHQEEYQVDTICVNGIVDHYEVKTK